MHISSILKGGRDAVDSDVISSIISVVLSVGFGFEPKISHVLASPEAQIFVALLNTLLAGHDLSFAIVKMHTKNLSHL